MTATNKHRTTHFVDRTVQGALARRVLVHWVMFLTMSIVSVTLMQVLLGDPSKTVFEHIAAAGSRYALFLIVLASLLPAFVLDTIRLSNRFAGPICRLRNALKNAAEGQPHQPLKFRGTDFWQGLADDYNAMMERYAAGTLARSTEPSAQEKCDDRDSCVESKKEELDHQPVNAS